MSCGGSGIPDALWLERDKRRRSFVDVRNNPYNWLDQESIIRTMVKRWRAVIAEIHDTSLRWRLDEAPGHRKIAHAYWLIYDATDTVTNLRNARKHLLNAIKAEPGNWLQHHNIGMVYEHLQQLEQALTSYREALRLAPNSGVRDQLRQRCAEMDEAGARSQGMLDFSPSDNEQNAHADTTNEPKASPITRARLEGALRAGIRLELTRDSGLRAEALAEHGAICMMCGVDLCQHYPEEYAQRAIEVHHLVPLHQSGPVNSSVQDVWVVCSNCHDVIHAWIEDGGNPEAVTDAGLYRPIDRQNLNERPRCRPAFSTGTDEDNLSENAREGA